MEFVSRNSPDDVLSKAFARWRVIPGIRYNHDIGIQINDNSTIFHLPIIVRIGQYL